jgi:hypothetical protein
LQEAEVLRADAADRLAAARESADKAKEALEAEQKAHTEQLR